MSSTLDAYLTPIDFGVERIDGASSLLGSVVHCFAGGHVQSLLLVLHPWNQSTHQFLCFD
ncbi:hypothetical protein N9W57_03485 [Pseudomonadales bacterium]|nr:hypothetical protein [Pseudomonadales bacterium]